MRSGQYLLYLFMTQDTRLGPCDVPNVVTISNESGTLWLGQITEFNQYQSLLEWALASKVAETLLPLPKEFCNHTLHPFRKFDSGIDLHSFS